jgi:hypothetical protein
VESADRRGGPGSGLGARSPACEGDCSRSDAGRGTTVSVVRYAGQAMHVVFAA